MTGSLLGCAWPRPSESHGVILSTTDPSAGGGITVGPKPTTAFGVCEAVACPEARTARLYSPLGWGVGCLLPGSLAGAAWRGLLFGAVLIFSSTCVCHRLCGVPKPFFSFLEQCERNVLFCFFRYFFSPLSHQGEAALRLLTYQKSQKTFTWKCTGPVRLSGIIVKLVCSEFEARLIASWMTNPG